MANLSCKVLDKNLGKQYTSFERIVNSDHAFPVEQHEIINSVAKMILLCKK